MTIQPTLFAGGVFGGNQPHANGKEPYKRAKTPAIPVAGAGRPMLTALKGSDANQDQAAHSNSQSTSDIDAQFDHIGDEALVAIDQAGAASNIFLKQSRHSDVMPNQSTTTNSGSFVQLDKRPATVRASRGALNNNKPITLQPPMQHNQTYSGISATAGTLQPFKPVSPGKHHIAKNGLGIKRSIEDVRFVQQDTRDKRAKGSNQNSALETTQHHDNAFNRNVNNEQGFPNNESNVEGSLVQQPLAPGNKKSGRKQGRMQAPMQMVEPQKPKEYFETAEYFHDPKAFLLKAINPGAIWEQVIAGHEHEAPCTAETAQQELEQLDAQTEMRLREGWQRGCEIVQSMRVCQDIVRYKDEIILHKERITKQYHDASFELTSKCYQLSANTQKVKMQKKMKRGTTPGMRSTPDLGSQGSGQPAVGGSRLDNVNAIFHH